MKNSPIWPFICLWFIAMKGKALSLCVLTLSLSLPGWGGTVSPEVAVVPMIGGDRDSASMDVARSLTDFLTARGQLRLVASSVVEDAVAYWRPVAVEDETRAAFRRRLSTIKSAYLHFDNVTMNRELDLVRSTLASDAEWAEKNGDLVSDFYLLDSMNAISRRDEGAASAALAQWLAIDPLANADHDTMSPRLTFLMEREKQARLREPQSSVTMTSRPEAVEIFVNGIPRGVTPATLVLPKGRYWVEWRGSHYVSHGQWVDVEKENEKRHHTMKWESRPESVSANMVAYGHECAERLHVDRVAVVDVAGDRENGMVTVRMIDRATGGAFAPMTIAMDQGDSRLTASLEEAARRIERESVASIDRHVDDSPDALGRLHPSEMDRSSTKRGWWIGLGIAGLAAVAGGLAAGLSGGGAPPNVGAAEVTISP